MSFDYINLRKKQAKIVQYQIFDNGILFNYLQQKEFENFARLLADKYFHKSKDLIIFENVLELYNFYLVIAPILQRIVYSFKLDWNRSHFLSLLRKNLAFNVNRKFLRVRQLERQVDPEILELNLRELGIKDKPFIDVAKDLFLRNYNTIGVRGKLANCIFDPIMFLFKRDEFEIRRGNELLKLEKRPFKNSIDIDLESVCFWDYEIKRQKDKKARKGYLEIKIRPEVIRDFKENMKNIIKSDVTVARKIVLLNQRCDAFIENHKYTKDAFDQINELKNWLNRRVKGIAGTDKRVKPAVDLTKRYIEKKDTKLRFKKPNFFWNYREYDQKQYINFFSPYRES